MGIIAEKVIDMKCPTCLGKGEVAAAQLVLERQELLNARELATVLAALRLWQETVNRHEEPMWEIATDDGMIEPLSDDEIDELCERLNTE